MDHAPAELRADGCYVGLTTDHLNVQAVMDRVRSPEAGAIVMFAGQRTLRLLTRQHAFFTM